MNEKSEKSSLSLIDDKYFEHDFKPIEADTYPLEVSLNRELHFKYIRKMMSSLRMSLTLHL